MVNKTVAGVFDERPVSASGRNRSYASPPRFAEAVLVVDLVGPGLFGIYRAAMGSWAGIAAANLRYLMICIDTDCSAAVPLPSRSGHHHPRHRTAANII